MGVLSIGFIGLCDAARSEREPHMRRTVKLLQEGYAVLENNETW